MTTQQCETQQDTHGLYMNVAVCSWCHQCNMTLFWWLWHGAVLVRRIQTLWMHLFRHFQGSWHILQQTPSILGCYTVSLC